MRVDLTPSRSWRQRLLAAFVLAAQPGALTALVSQSQNLLGPLPRDVPLYRLNDGWVMPALGLGVYRVPPGEVAYQTVKSALELGYRMVDTAAFYGNEADVGRACRDSGIPRDELFITTKVWDFQHGFHKAMASGRQSNKLLGLGYIDLILIHSPGMLVPGAGKIVETYDALLQLQEEGTVRSVGVSNFAIKHLEALAKFKRPVPTLNQFELHPLIFQDRKDLVEYCRKKQIIVQAYGSVLSGHKDLIDRMSKASRGHGKSTVQVLLRWALDQGFAVLPKSTHKERQDENIRVFDFHLTKPEIQGLNSVLPDRGSLYWNPLTTPVDIGDVTARDKYKQR